MTTEVSANVRVLFRVWRKGGGVMAIFPDLPSYYDPYLCLSYEDQTSPCDPLYCIRVTRPATPTEYTSLKRELEKLNYQLEVVRVYPHDAIDKRRRELARIDFRVGSSKSGV